MKVAQVWVSCHGHADCAWRTEVVLVPDVRKLGSLDLKRLSDGCNQNQMGLTNVFAVV